MVKSLEELEQLRLAFEKYASNRGMSIERTCDSYKSQAAKSAWNAWCYQQWEINKLHNLLNEMTHIGYCSDYINLLDCHVDVYNEKVKDTDLEVYVRNATVKMAVNEG